MLLIKGTSKTIKNEAKEQKEGFIGMFLGTLGPSFLGNLLTDKRTIRKTKLRQNKPKFNGVY